MRAVVCREYGSHRDMAVEEVAEPELRPGTARIAIAAAGTGFANLLAIEGRHQNSPALPFTPGTEAGGTVLEVADDVDRLVPGQRVAASVRYGAFAEQAVVPIDNLFPLPDAVDFATATHFPSIYATAYGCLVLHGRLRRGESLLVHGAGGGSGLAAVDLGRHLGARVIATAGDAAKLAAARASGAAHLINHRDEDFRQRVLELTDGRGVDAVFDPVGGEMFRQSLRCVAPEARLFPVGFVSGDIPQIPANILLVKNISVHGVNWGYYAGWSRTPRTARDIERVHAGMAELFRWCAEGHLAPVLHGTFDLADFAAALDLIADRKVIGKVVLTT